MARPDGFHGWLLVAMLAGAGVAYALKGTPATAGPGGAGAAPAAATPSGGTAATDASAAAAAAAAPAVPPAGPPALPAGVGTLTPQAVAAKARPATGATPAAGALAVLDVRTPQEFAEGHVPGAINVPHDQLASRLDELRGLKGREIAVYCRSGRRAASALEVLAKQGYTGLHYMQGDIVAWTAAGLPVEKGAAAAAPAPAARPGG